MSICDLLTVAHSVWWQQGVFETEVLKYDKHGDLSYFKETYLKAYKIYIGASGHLKQICLILYDAFYLEFENCNTPKLVPQLSCLSDFAEALGTSL